MRASVWLTGLMLLVGGYAVLLLAAQSAISEAAASGEPAGPRSLPAGWGSPPTDQRDSPASRAGAGIRFNQDSAGTRVSIGPDPSGSDSPTVPPVLASLPAEVLARSGEHAGLAAGLTWILGLSAAAALLRRA